MAIVAYQPAVKHRPAQTLGVLAGVALVTRLVEFIRHVGIDRRFAGGRSIRRGLFGATISFGNRSVNCPWYECITRELV